MNNTSAISLPAMKNGMPSINPFRFLGICVLFLCLVSWLPDSVFALLNHATASLAGECLAIIDTKAEVAGNIISLNGFRVLIITECTPLYSGILFGAFIISAPASLRSRLAGLLAGMPFLVTVNTLRIALITMVGATCPAIFEAAHIYLAQVVMIILVVAASFFWLRLATRSEEMNFPFLMRALAMASIIFLPWLIFNEAYVKALDRLTAGIFALADYRLVIPYGHLVYFQTFNTVLFLALILAEQRLSLRRRAAWAAVGTALLAFGHLLFRIGNVLLTAFSWQPALPLTISLSVMGEYLLPLLLWLAAIRAFKTVKER